MRRACLLGRCACLCAVVSALRWLQVVIVSVIAATAVLCCRVHHSPCACYTAMQPVRAMHHQTPGQPSSLTLLSPAVPCCAFCVLPQAVRESSDTGEEGEGMEVTPSSPSIQEKELKAASQPSNTNGNTSGSNESDASKR